MNKLTLLALTLLLSAPAIAENKFGFFVEPMLTYESGEADVDLPSPFGSSQSDINGLGIGGRIGFHAMEVLFVGIDGRYSRLTYENNDTNIDTDATSYNFGPIIGLQVPGPLGIRVWAGMITNGEMDLEKDQGVDFTFKDAGGYRVGAGIKLASVSLNLEYQEITYDKTQMNDAGIFSGSTRKVDQEYKSYVLSVSFPFAL